MINEKTQHKIETILKHIKTIKNDVGDKTLEEFQDLGDNKILWQKSYIKKRSSML